MDTPRDRVAGTPTGIPAETPADAASHPPDVPGTAPTGRMIGTRELRAHLTEALRRAAAGERTIVTSGGRPVAQLAPLDEHAPALEQLLASGAVVAPRRTGDLGAPRPVQTWSGTRLDQALRELRG